jgi:hypothetical protein
MAHVCAYVVIPKQGCRRPSTSYCTAIPALSCSGQIRNLPALDARVGSQSGRPVLHTASWGENPERCCAFLPLRVLDFEAANRCGQRGRFTRGWCGVAGAE